MEHPPRRVRVVRQRLGQPSTAKLATGVQHVHDGEIVRQFEERAQLGAIQCEGERAPHRGVAEHGVAVVPVDGLDPRGVGPEMVMDLEAGIGAQPGNRGMRDVVHHVHGPRQQLGQLRTPEP